MWALILFIILAILVIRVGVKLAWGILKFVCGLVIAILLPVALLALIAYGLIYVGLPLLIVVFILYLLLRKA